MANGVVLSGFKEFNNKLKNLPKQVMREIDREVQDGADNWEQRAKRDAPVDQGLLRNDITNHKVAEANWEITSKADYSAYLEWGTKTKVRVPAELSAYAAQFKGGQKGGDAKRFIYEWCKRVGIPEEAWWFVYVSIMVKGINPHPFFFIQRKPVEKELIGNIKRVLNTPH